MASPEKPIESPALGLLVRGASKRRSPSIVAIAPASPPKRSQSIRQRIGRAAAGTYITSLELENANLNAKVSHLEKQLGSAFEQAGWVFNDFQSRKNGTIVSLQGSVEFLTHELDRAQTKANDTVQLQLKLERAEEELRRVRDYLVTKSKQYTKELEACETQLEDREQQLNAYQTQLKAKEEEMAVVEKKVESITKELEDKDQHPCHHNQDYEAIEEKMKKLMSENNAALGHHKEEMKKAMDEKVEALDRQYQRELSKVTLQNAGQHRAQNVSLKGEVEKLTTEREVLKNMHESLKVKHDALKEKLDAVEDEFYQFKIKHQASKIKYKAFQKKQEAFEAKHEALKDKHEDLLRRQHVLYDDLTKVEHKRDELQRWYNNVENENQTLDAHVRKTEKFIDELEKNRIENMEIAKENTLKLETANDKIVAENHDLSNRFNKLREGNKELYRQAQDAKLEVQRLEEARLRDQDEKLALKRKLEEVQAQLANTSLPGTSIDEISAFLFDVEDKDE